MAWLDPEFEAKLKADPKKTITEFTNGEVFFAEGESVEIDSTTFTWRIVPPLHEANKAIMVIPVPPRPAGVTTEELKRWAEEDKGEIVERFLVSCC
jgi:hypothetical protein